MMSEKRFELVNGIITDMQDDERMYGIFELVDKLNEQSERIKSLEMELDLIANTKLFSRRKLEEENEELRKKLECCEYEHFKKEQDKIYQKVKKGDLSDLDTLTISDKGLEHWNGVLK